MSNESVSSELKWDRIYRKQIGEGRQPGEPSYALTRALAHLPAKGTALDLAAGLGNNSLFLASQGLKVDAWDISGEAVSYLNQLARESSLAVNASRLEIDPTCFSTASYDVIANCHFLDRQLFGAMGTALKPGGLLIFQTFAAGKVADIGPSNPDFLLEPGELQAVFSDLQVLEYQDETDNPNLDHPMAGRVMLIARKSS